MPFLFFFLVFSLSLSLSLSLFSSFHGARVIQL
jgi:hypothetical protein